MDNTPIAPETNLTADERTECRWLGAVVALWLAAVAVISSGCATVAPEPVKPAVEAPRVISSAELVAPHAPCRSTVANLKAGAYVIASNADVSAENVETLKLALEHVNGMAGFDVFAWSDYVALAQGVATTETWPDSIAAAARHSNGSCTLMLGNLQIDIVVLAHEAIHCLGVEHDDDRDSLMFPDRIWDRDQALTDETLALLRQMHGE